MRLNRSLWLGLVAALCAGAARSDTGVTILDRRPTLDDKAPIVYWHEAWSRPRPLHIFGLRIDLTAPDCEVATFVADDVDGEGPGQSSLAKPLELAAKPGVLAAVNANAFMSLPDKEGKRNTEWTPGKPVDIVGWAMADRRQVSAPLLNYMSFWVDGHGSAHVGNLKESCEAVQAVAGFGALLIDGEDRTGEDYVLHPRTSLGISGGRWLWLAVVDGRQPGYSEGMTTTEMAVLMEEFGCRDAINLDGGGSSVMLIDAGKGALELVNKPSQAGTRPIPVMLGVRRRAAPAGN